MKIEIEENTGVAIVITVLIICFTVASIQGCRTCEQTKRIAIEKGLVQTDTTTTTTKTIQPVP